MGGAFSYRLIPRARHSRQWLESETGEPIGGVLPQDGPAALMRFSPDGRRLLSGGRLWDVVYLTDADPPDALLLRAQANTGLRLDRLGEIESIPVAEWRSLRKRLNAVQAGGK